MADLKVIEVFIHIGKAWLEEFFGDELVPINFVDRVHDYYRERLFDDVLLEVEMVDQYRGYGDDTRLEMWATCIDEDGDEVEIHSSSTDFQFLVGFSTGDDVWHT